MRSVVELLQKSECDLLSWTSLEETRKTGGYGVIFLNRKEFIYGNCSIEKE